MAIEKIKVLMDNFLDRVIAPAFSQQILVKDVVSESIMNNMWYDNITQTIQCGPEQLYPNWNEDSSIERLDLSDWNANTAHWEKVEYDEDIYLLSNGTDAEIETNDEFGVNAGFMLQFQIWRGNTDIFDCLEIKFGQYHAKIRSDGHIRLFDDEENPLSAGWLTHKRGKRLLAGMNELMILPCGNGLLTFRLTGGGHYIYKISEPEIVEDIPQIIKSGKFKLKAPNNRVRFQLTQLQYDTTKDYDFVTSNFALNNAPIAEQTLSTDFVWHFTGDGIVSATFKNPHQKGDLVEDLTSFNADGENQEICCLIGFVPTQYNSPSLEMFTLSYDEVREEEDEDGGVDITSDIRFLSMSIGEDPTETELSFNLRNPRHYEIIGQPNRLVKVLHEGKTRFIGYFKQPAGCSHSQRTLLEGTITVQGIGKLLNNAVLPGNLILDHYPHTEAVKILCLYAGLIEEDLDFDIDNTVLHTPIATEEGESEFNFVTKATDTPLQWINRICDETGWIFTDGYNAEGNYVIKYIDPLSMSRTSKHTFVFKSEDEQKEDDYPYQRVFSQNVEYEDPETNELYVIGTDVDGNITAARYRVMKDQDGSLEPNQRGEHWLGERRPAFIEYNGYKSAEELISIALKIGREVTKKLQWINIHCEYPIGLWVNDCIDFILPIAEYKEFEGKFRIKNISINFETEGIEIPLRTANISAVKLIEVGEAE